LKKKICFLLVESQELPFYHHVWKRSPRRTVIYIKRNRKHRQHYIKCCGRNRCHIGPKRKNGTKIESTKKPVKGGKKTPKPVVKGGTTAASGKGKTASGGKTVAPGDPAVPEEPAAPGDTAAPDAPVKETSATESAPESPAPGTPAPGDPVSGTTGGKGR